MKPEQEQQNQTGSRRLIEGAEERPTTRRKDKNDDDLANELAIPLSHIFKCSMATGIVLEDWVIVNVAVIHNNVPRRNVGIIER